MDRYYYDCALKAAYMSKYFDVKFWLPVIIANNNCENGIDILSSIEVTFKERGRINVHPESESIFEPKEGDIGLYADEDEDYLRCAKCDGEDWEDEGGAICPSKYYITVKRNGKLFFMPKMEEQNDI